MGLAIAVEQPELAAQELIQTLCAVVPEAPITLYVPLSSIPAYQEALNHSVGLKERISITADNWPMWIEGARSATLNLMTGLSTESGVKVDWRPWRWALILAAIILIVNICALNIDWWQMKNEAATLRSTMTQIYQARYPKEFVIIDPIAQMRQKIAFAKRDSGLASADDFTTLAATFGEVWNSATSTEKPAIAKLDYREHGLFVTFKASPNDVSVALIQQIKTALVSRNLSLTVVPSEPGSVSWQIGSAK
jgi:general secretion pathway protein L